MHLFSRLKIKDGRLRLNCDDTRAETRFRLSAKLTSPFESARASVQSSTGSRSVRISGSNAGYTMFGSSVRVLATHSIRQFPLHFPFRASQCAITFQLDSSTAFLKLFSSGDHFHLSECSTDHPTLGIIKLIRPALNSVRNMFFATENPSFVVESRVGRVVYFIKCQSWERKFKDACCM